MLSGKWSKYGHKNGTYFIEEAYTEGIILEKTLFQEKYLQLSIHENKWSQFFGIPDPESRSISGFSKCLIKYFFEKYHSFCFIRNSLNPQCAICYLYETSKQSQNEIEGINFKASFSVRDSAQMK